MFAMTFSPARKRKTPCTQRVHKFYGDVGGRKISRIDTGFVYEYRFLLFMTTKGKSAVSNASFAANPRPYFWGVFTYGYRRLESTAAQSLQSLLKISLSANF
jgi:hypothetical protein